MKPFWDYPLMGRAHEFDSWWAYGGLAQRALAEGRTLHKFYRNGALRSSYTIEGLLDALLALGGRIAFHALPSVKNGQENWILVDHDRALDLVYTAKDRSMNLVVYGLMDSYVAAVADEALRAIGRVQTRGRVFVMTETSQGPMIEQVGVAGEEFIAGNYRPETVTDYRHVVEDLNSSDPCGRIAILDGPPGTGKTHMVRALLNEVPKGTFVLVPSNMLAALGSPSLVRALMGQARKGYPIILIVEDADECLASRKADNLSQISALLNFSDGIFGALIDLRIIATTNVPIDDLDEAVMRGGRLCKRIEVGKLDHEQALAVYNRLTKQLDGPFTRGNFYPLGDVYKAARKGSASVPFKPAKRRMGFLPEERGELPEAFEAGFKPGDVVTTGEGDVVRVREDGQFEAMRLSKTSEFLIEDGKIRQISVGVFGASEDTEDDDLIDEDPNQTPSSAEETVDDEDDG